MKSAAIILSAGKGSRVASLGEKPFLKIEDKTFLEVAFEKAQRAGFQPIVIVTNQELFDKIENLKLDAEIVVNPHPERGMLSSLHCGLSLLDAEVTGFLLNPVDYPLVEQTTFHKLYELHQKELDCIIKPIYQNKTGHPVIFPSVVFEDLRNASLSEGARSVVKKYPQLVQIVEVDDPGILININTPGMYQKYCK